MKIIRKKFFVMLLSAMLLLGISSNVQAAGCSDYKRISTGTAKCTNNLCPGGFKRKERQDLYQQTCVRANGTLYYNQKYKNVYVNCSCT